MHTGNQAVQSMAEGAGQVACPRPEKISGRVLLRLNNLAEACESTADRVNDTLTIVLKDSTTEAPVEEKEVDEAFPALYDEIRALTKRCERALSQINKDLSRTEL